MPLPCILKHGAKKCTAMSKRTKQPCKNPAAYGCRSCRIHGARKAESIKRGKNHPNFKHGGCTLETRAEYREKSHELAELKKIMKKLGMLIS